MSDKQQTGNIRTPEFRASFVAVDKPAKAMQPGAEEKFSITMLFPKTANLQPLKDAVKAVLVAELGADQKKWPKNLRNPLRDQGEKEYEGYEAGAFFINATSKQRPGVVDARVQPIDNSSVYSGSWCRATVRPFYYDKAGNKGVSFGLQNVQFLRDGDPLGGRTRPENDFDAVDTGEDPFNKGDDMPASDSVGGKPAAAARSEWD